MELKIKSDTPKIIWEGPVAFHFDKGERIYHFDYFLPLMVNYKNNGASELSVSDWFEKMNK